MSDNHDDDPLARLVGSELSSVQFIRDYMQLHFEDSVDSPTLTCYVLPEVQRFQSDPPTGIAEGRPGYADAIRALIGEEVRAASTAECTGLVIELGRGAIIVNPDSDQLVGPEIAMLSGFSDRAWMMWRPGEDEFAHLT